MLRVIVLLLILASSAAAQQPPRLTATLSRTGELVFRTPEAAEPVVVIRPSLSDKPGSLAPGESAGKAFLRHANGDPSVPVQLEAQIAAAGDSRSIRIRCRFGDDQPVPLPALHLAIVLPADKWTRAKATRGDAEVVVPDASRNPVLLETGPGELQLSRQGTVLRASSEIYSNALVDRRPQGGRHIEIRFKAASASTTETIECTLRLPGPVRVVREEPLLLSEGDDWVPLDSPGTVTPGSPLDFSNRTGNRSGDSAGRLIPSPDGHLVAESAKRPVRIWGTQLVGNACFPDPSQADILADKIAAVGYNAVRFEDFDHLHGAPGNAERMDALVAALRKRGMWLGATLCSRRPVPGYTPEHFRLALLIREPALENWKEFCRKLLLRTNPGTGRTLKDEPSLAFLCAADSIDIESELPRIEGKLRDEFETAWQAWCKERNIPTSPLPKSLADNPASQRVRAFFHDLEAKAYAKMDQFLRKEIGVRALVTGFASRANDSAALLARIAEPLVDRRYSWDTPIFLDQPGKPPFSGSHAGRSQIGAPEAAPAAIAMDRIYGKPLLVSGHGTAFPNSTRYEESILAGAMAGLQDWDALFSDRWAATPNTAVSGDPEGFQDIASDPARLASERIAALAFLRRDQTSAPQAISDLVSIAAVVGTSENKPGPGFPEMAWVTRTGKRVSGTATPPPPAGPGELRLTGADSAAALDRMLAENRLPAANKTNLDSDSRHSETNQVFVDGALGTFRWITPRTVVGIGPEAETLRFGKATVLLADCDGLFWITALDNQPLPSSQRLLVAHVTDIQYAGTKFYSSERKVLESAGTKPALARHGRMVVDIERNTAPKSVEVWRLDQTGLRTSPVVTTVDSTHVRFTADNRGPDGKAVLYYEIVVADPPAKPNAKPAKP